MCGGEAASDELVPVGGAIDKGGGLVRELRDVERVHLWIVGEEHDLRVQRVERKGAEGIQAAGLKDPGSVAQPAPSLAVLLRVERRTDVHTGLIC